MSKFTETGVENAELERVAMLGAEACHIDLLIESCQRRRLHLLALAQTRDLPAKFVSGAIRMAEAKNAVEAV